MEDVLNKVLDDMQADLKGGKDDVDSLKLPQIRMMYRMNSDVVAELDEDDVVGGVKN